ncbi:FtsX-like permease family protein [Streptococcus marmotae]|uniref:FtsX-like permease family protein n=1 Tax=Streptococcus marmotae TaxID=1825069 RepID=UPI0008297AB3|nr:ABC transporter permease [Streptococcus marmotae]
MYPKLILRNVQRNLQTYTVYFLSLTLIYSLLYAFNALPSHPVMQSLSGAKEMMTTIMTQYMGLLSYVILSTIAFLVVYSTGFVLGRRKQELGLYATLGMKKRHIVGTLFCETMVVNLFALLAGFILGLGVLIILAHIASNFFMGNYFGNMFFIDMKSVNLLGISYLATSGIIGVMDIFTFRKQAIISLIQENGVKSSIFSKGETKWQAVLFILSALVICFGCVYLSDYTHISILRNWGMLLITLFVLVIFIFYSTLSYFLIRLTYSLPNWYFKKYNSFKLRQLSKQADRNSVTISVLSLSLTLATSLLIFSGSAYSSLSNDLNKFIPYDIDVQMFKGEKYHYNHIDVKNKLKEDGFDFSIINKEFEYPTYISDLTYKDIIDTSHLWDLDKGLGDSFVPIVSLTDYNSLLRFQGKKEVDLSDNEFLINANYKGTRKQISEFLSKNNEVTVLGITLKSASKTPLENVYFVTTVENNDRGTLIVPDKVVKKLTVNSLHYVALYKKGIDKRKVESFLESWIEQYYFTNQEGNQSDFVYQTKVRSAELYLGFMGVIVLVLIFVGVIFTVITLSILSLQASTNALESVNDYNILYLLGNQRKQNKKIIFQQILAYFLVPMLIAIPLSWALSNSLLGYFENFANTTVVIDAKYLLFMIGLFTIYLYSTYKICTKASNQT